MFKKILILNVIQLSRKGDQINNDGGGGGEGGGDSRCMLRLNFILGLINFIIFLYFGVW